MEETASRYGGSRGDQPAWGMRGWLTEPNSRKQPRYLILHTSSDLRLFFWNDLENGKRKRNLQ